MCKEEGPPINSWFNGNWSDNRGMDTLHSSREDSGQKEIKPRVIFKKTWTIDALKRLIKEIKEIF